MVSVYWFLKPSVILSAFFPLSGRLSGTYNNLLLFLSLFPSEVLDGESNTSSIFKILPYVHHAVMYIQYDAYIDTCVCFVFPSPALQP